MARIRSLKPEFWSSPGIEQISPWARLLFQAMWNWADDAGRGTCNIRELQTFAFPNDEAVPEVGTSDGFRRTLSEVRGQFGVAFYKVNGRPYYAIPSWKSHQRNERVAQGRHPAPEDGEPWDFLPPTSGGAEPPPGDDGGLRSFRPSMSEAPQTSVPVLEEQGNRGTGEVKTSASGDSGMFPDIPPAAPKVDLDAEFDTFWADYPLKRGKEPARKAFAKARKSGVPLEKIRSGARQYGLEVRGLDHSKVKYPQGWLTDRRWQDYDEPGQPRLRAVSGGYQPYQNPTDTSGYYEEL